MSDLSPEQKWSARQISRTLAMQFFNRKYLVMVPECNWTGYECDLLCVTTDLRIIDIEIKISRSDLKADAKKDKWWHREFKGYGPVRDLLNRHGNKIGTHRDSIYDVTQRMWPPKVWKHYFVMPKDIWDSSLMASIASPNSGVLLLTERGPIQSPVGIRVARPAKPNKDAEKISPAAAIDIARLASLRMWNTYRELDSMRETQP